MELSAARELYRRADMRLREVLFGDSTYSAGGLRGEDQRAQARIQLRRMRDAFDRVFDEAKEGASRAQLAEDLLDAARREPSKTEDL